ncbi:TonB-dependent receptor plug domain-containing protein [Neptunitalea lumnitzerae]|uniref:TonB-dependent receptor plug domain-containing protein n=1 Tax=Neptunitalea lumnitzerae TaxID=2965509 RepID=A0ABQ5MIN2_9FLAO|nr:TonB-dependent receptor plug domain-containing protein [Neptunitalea sp. Y10]GLB49181.1 hypothetical protein Y10_15490 [Neptunitalea sp. Y10]
MKSIFFTVVFIFIGYKSFSQTNTSENIAITNNETIAEYTITTNNIVLNTWQDVANQLNCKVPSVQVILDQFGQIQQMSIRNQETNIVYIDGVRTTMEALQMLNPADIESIKVLPNTNTYIPVND